MLTFRLVWDVSQNRYSDTNKFTSKIFVETIKNNLEGKKTPEQINKQYCSHLFRSSNEVTLDIPELTGYVPDYHPTHHLSHTAITNTKGCYSMGTLGNVPLAKRYPWALHCGCPELHSVEDSPQISRVTCF